VDDFEYTKAPLASFPDHARRAAIAGERDERLTILSHLSITNRACSSAQFVKRSVEATYRNAFQSCPCLAQAIRSTSNARISRRCARVDTARAADHFRYCETCVCDCSAKRSHIFEGSTAGNDDLHSNTGVGAMMGS